MQIKLTDIKKLREETSAGVADCRQALEEAKGKMDEAIKILRKKGIERAEKKSEREVKTGAVFSYVHHNQTLGSLVSVASETDFVAKNSQFQNLGHELAMQVAAAKPRTMQELLGGQYIRDPKKTVSELIKETIGKLGENIQVLDFKVIVI